MSDAALLAEQLGYYRARDHAAPADGTAVRRLADGREFRVVKVFRTPGQHARRLRRPGLVGEFAASGRFFVHGGVHPA